MLVLDTPQACDAFLRTQARCFSWLSLQCRRRRQLHEQLCPSYSTACRCAHQSVLCQVVLLCFDKLSFTCKPIQRSVRTEAQRRYACCLGVAPVTKRCLEARITHYLKRLVRLNAGGLLRAGDAGRRAGRVGGQPRRAGGRDGRQRDLPSRELPLVHVLARLARPHGGRQLERRAPRVDLM